MKKFQNLPLQSLNKVHLRVVPHVFLYVYLWTSQLGTYQSQYHLTRFKMMVKQAKAKKGASSAHRVGGVAGRNQRLASLGQCLTLKVTLKEKAQGVLLVPSLLLGHKRPKAKGSKKNMKCARDVRPSVNLDVMNASPPLRGPLTGPSFSFSSSRVWHLPSRVIVIVVVVVAPSALTRRLLLHCSWTTRGACFCSFINSFFGLLPRLCVGVAFFIKKKEKTVFLTFVFLTHAHTLTFQAVHFLWTTFLVAAVYHFMNWVDKCEQD